MLIIFVRFSWIASQIGHYDLKGFDKEADEKFIKLH